MSKDDKKTEESREGQESKHATTLREYVDSLLVTVILALFGTTFVLQAFKIPSSSMEDTLLVGDHLLVNKFVFAGEAGSLLPYREVQRGDIIVFKYPFYPYQHFVKRVVAVPGDRLRIVDRQVYLNGSPLEEPYKIHRRPVLPGGFQDNFPPLEGYLPYASQSEWADWARELARQTMGEELVIPPGKYFVMGDNRDNSQDSRYWGFVDRHNIIGRPLLIYWSFNGSPHTNARGNSRPAAWDNLTHFFSRTRWGRLLHFVQ